ncbi:SDR family NAD(P)-dependent oxidoreductase [Nocardioides pocheonensis]|uniref:SDR family oxidoreductase n=1 Tax=Nocardioides pocheonensis TaxID=661485 RepID=A0A3N0GIB4_9ACTN|nr:SDR family oxidoreductase [Nocardioides pocheonensis]RNM12215.1 SDR family oxidoreductase [Nocardioides pocheonensis]
MTTTRVAVVTGAASGIGAATVARLAADSLVAGIDVVASPRAGVLDLTADVSQQPHVDAAFARIIADFGHVDVLVNNAGTTGGAHASLCHDSAVEDSDLMMAVNVRGPFPWAKAVLPAMLARRSEHIMNVASIAAQVAFPERCARTASKGAVVAFIRPLAAAYAPAGIRANATCPGVVQTPMTHWRLDRELLRKKVEARVPLGRVARANEFAAAIAVLAGDQLSYITGHTLVLDVGWTAI